MPQQDAKPTLEHPTSLQDSSPIPKA
jgi:hypothetical protein